MSILDLARKDWQSITSDLAGFGVSLDLEAPNAETVTVVGLATKHHIGIDTDGNLVNTKNAHCSFSEALLLENNPSYPLRGTDGEVALQGHKLTYADSTGGNKVYVIREWFPDETVGMVVCILEDFE